MKYLVTLGNPLTEETLIIYCLNVQDIQVVLNAMKEDYELLEVKSMSNLLTKEEFLEENGFLKPGLN